MIKKFHQYIKESLSKEEQTDALEGYPISLIKTKHYAKYNPDLGENEMLVSTEDIDGFIGNIGIDPDGYEQNGFWIFKTNDFKGRDIKEQRRLMIGYALYNYNNNDKFREGNSIFHYEYTGKTDKDIEILNEIKNIFKK